jgi:hypothetical protein
LEAIADDGAVVCATDMPFCDGRAAAVARGPRRAVRGDRRAAPSSPIRARDGADAARCSRQRRITRAVAGRLATRHIDVGELAQFGDARRLLANINTAAELAAADG